MNELYSEQEPQMSDSADHSTMENHTGLDMEEISELSQFCCKLSIAVYIYKSKLKYATNGCWENRPSSALEQPSVATVTCCSSVRSRLCSLDNC